jgi:signal transduction histidine kinase
MPKHAQSRSRSVARALRRPVAEPTHDATDGDRQSGEHPRKLVARPADSALMQATHLAGMLEALAHAVAQLSDATVDPSIDERALLKRFLGHARVIAGARHAALGLGTDPEQPFDPWVYDGFDEACATGLGAPPRAVGVLGHVARSGEAMRVADVRGHAMFRGVPANHPEMKSFLGVPVRARGVSIGNLYLANKVDGTEFSVQDQHVITLLVEQMGVVLLNRRLYEQARTAIRARDEVLAVVSHDLRNPLNAIVLQASAIERAPATEACSSATAIRRAALRMNLMIQDLLNGAALDAGVLALDRVVTDPKALARDALEAITPLAAERSVHLALDVAAAGDATISCDRARLMQVLSNLLGNAIKYAPRSGHVRLAVVATDGLVQLEVHDDGPGIAEADRPFLFERYWKTKSGVPGTGLGLHIAKSIVTLHSGRIWVESEVGRGSTFVAAFPEHRVVP